MLDSGQVLSEQTVYAGNTVQRPVNPTKENYEFIGWYTVDGNGDLTNKFNISQEITGNTLVYAKFEPKTYSVDYILPYGAYNDNIIEYTYGEGLELNDPQLDEHEFSGWYTDKDYTKRIENISNTQSGNLVLYAKFAEKTYKVEYILDGGKNSSDNPTTYKFGEYYKLSPASRQGYTFGGWYEDQSFTSKRTSIDTDNRQDFVLYAQWIPDVYTVTFELYGGTLQDGEEQSFSSDTGLSELPTPTRPGYTFAGWYLEP